MNCSCCSQHALVPQCNHNLIVQWGKRECCSIKNNIINLGIEKTDPVLYEQMYGSTLLTADQMPSIVNEVQMEHQMQLAADTPDFKYYMELEGDVYALSFLDLDKEGLSEYKSYLLMMNPDNKGLDEDTSSLCSSLTSLPSLAINSKSQVKKFIENEAPSIDNSPIVNTVFHNELVLDQNKKPTIDLSKFPDNEIEELRQAFTLFDTNRNDYLSKQEIGAVLNNLAQYPTEEELQKLMDDLDKDGDGKLTFPEFVQLMYNLGNISEISEEEEEAELKAAFKKAGITIQIIDNDVSRKEIMKNHENKLCAGSDNSVWIILTLSTHIQSVFHLEMLNYVLRPSYEYEEASWISHTWKHVSVEVNAKKTERKAYYKHVARVVNFFVKLMDKQIQKRVKCTILYATETGKSELFAKSLTEIFKHSFNAQCIDIKDYNISNLENESLIFMITSTFGNGDPPENDEEFKKEIFGMKKNKCLLKAQSGCCEKYEKQEEPSIFKNKLKFSVFGLGNSSYPKYCQYAKFLDCCLNDLGAERIHPIGLGDELCGQEEAFRKWSVGVYKAALEKFEIKTDLSFIESFWNDMSYNPQAIRLKIIAGEEPPSLCDSLSKLHNRNIRSTKLAKKRNLQSDESGRVTLNASLDAQGDMNVLNYEPGDHIGIFAPNRKEFVDAVIARALNAPGENQMFKLEILKEINTVLGVTKQWVFDDSFPATTFRFALTHLLDLTTPVSQSMLLHFSTQTSDEDERARLKKLAKDRVAYQEWKKFYPNLVETLEEFPSLRPDATLLVTQLPKLHARVYSISSWPTDIKKDPIDITVGVVEYTPKGRATHYGVCSKWLEELSNGELVPAFVRGAPSFHLPDDSTLPIIMIGAGTGIAPFRSFWQKRKLQMETMPVPEGTNQGWGEVVVYFGCRQCRIDELYRSEIDNLLRKKIITNYYGAYSREPNFKKTYVQDLINLNFDQMYDLLVNKKGHIYICGDVKMAEDVTNIIEKGIAQLSDMSPEEAKLYVTEMKENQRFHEDIFGNSLTINNECKCLEQI